MKKKQWVLMAVIGLMMLIIGGILGYRLDTGKERGFAEAQDRVKRETVIDTIVVTTPKSGLALTTGTRLYTLPIYRYIGGGSEPQRDVEAGGLDHSVDVKDSLRDPQIAIKYQYGTGAGGEPRQCDSAIVELPTIQRHYADSTYDAWVSGPIDPKLDSLRVYARTEIITKRERWPPKRWHIGPTVGFGYTPHGFQPHIGISLTYSIFSF